MNGQRMLKAVGYWQSKSGYDFPHADCFPSPALLVKPG